MKGAVSENIFESKKVYSQGNMKRKVSQKAVVNGLFVWEYERTDVRKNTRSLEIFRSSDGAQKLKIQDKK